MSNKDANSLYYDALTDAYLNTILTSGLLLDEDLQNILNYFKHQQSCHFPEYKPSFAVKLGLSALLGSSLLFGRTYKWLVFPAATFTAVSAALEIKNNILDKKRKNLIKDLIEITKKTSSLHVSIRKYIKTRIDAGRKSDNDFFTIYNKSVEDFLKNLFAIETIRFESYLDAFRLIASLSDELTDDFESIRNFRPLREEESRLDDAEKGWNFVLLVEDLHVWSTSKLLCYLSVAMLRPNDKLDGCRMGNLLNFQLPALLTSIRRCYDTKKTLFAALRSSVVKLNDIRSFKPPPNSSNRLLSSVATAADNLSIIFEKSQFILKELDSGDGGDASKDIETALLDLRNHTYAAYESIDLLCRLCGVLSSRKQPLDEPLILPEKDSTQTGSNVASINLRHDDDVRHVEENYEIYLDKDYDVPVEETSAGGDEPSAAYLELMLRELRHSLRKHERFVEAKRRRGSEDREECSEELEIPAFNLQALKVDDEAEEICKTDCSFNPPIPPPLPVNPNDFRSGNLNDFPSKTSTLIDGVKALSKQLDLREEVFGEIDSENDE